MLSTIRDRATGWLLWVIILIICIPFAFWGVNEYLAGGAELNVATVNGQDINQNSYRSALENRRAQITRLMGKNVDPEILNNVAFKKEVVDLLIDQQLQNQDVFDQGYTISDQELSDYIRTLTEFQTNGAFDQKKYQRYINFQRSSVAGFEQSIRNQTAVSQIRDSFLSADYVSDKEVERLLALTEQRRHFDYAILNINKVKDTVEVSEQEILSSFKQNLELYRTPERMKLAYVKLSLEDLSKIVTLTDEELKAVYKREQQRFTIPAKRFASHILIKPELKDNEESDKAALEKANKLYADLNAGAVFKTLATEHSQDPGSVKKGGELGEVITGVMVKPFESAVDTLSEVGQLSEPVKTRFGYHIIKLDKIIKAKITGFDEVKDQLLKDEQISRAEELFVNQAEEFKNLAYEQPESLEPIMEELSLEVKQTDWFSRSKGEGLAKDPRVREIAFSDLVQIEGLNSDTLELDLNNYIVVRKLELESSAQKPLEEVKDEIVKKLTNEKARLQIKQKGEQLLDQLNQGADWVYLINKEKLNSKTVVLKRDDNTATPSQKVKQAVFRGAAPKAGKQVNGGILENSGAYVLYRVIKQESADISKVDKASHKKLKTMLERRYSQDIFASYKAGLREGAEINVYPEQF